MKIIIGIIIALLGWIWIAHATLPDTIKDPATREVIEYLDAKLEDVRDGVTGPRGYPGPTGPTGATGATGPQGPAGADGADGVVDYSGVVLTTGSTMTGYLALPNLTATYGVSAATGVFTSSVTASAFYGDGSNLTGTGDNLGNHIATTTLQMGAYGIISSSNISAGRYDIGGSRVISTSGGAGSTFIGLNTGNLSTGIGNTFVGNQSGAVNTTGALNVFVGGGATNTVGYYNTFVGAGSGNGVAGNNNTFVGKYAGYINTGSDNVLLGSGAGASITSGSGNIVIGKGKTAPSATTSNYLNIGGAIVGDLATSSVTVNGVLSAPKICLAGDCQTAWPAGGGVVDSTAVIDGLPIGSIIQYSTTTAPDGYLYCDGSYVSTATYSSLFAITGHRYSTFTVSGSPAVFQLPDFRGMFARGAHGNLNSRDPEVRAVGSTQTDTMQGHKHGFFTALNGPSTTISPFLRGGFNAATYVHDDVNHGQTIQPDGTNGTVRTSTETRPENIAVAFMIKYGHVGTVAISSSSLLIGGDNTFTGENTFAGSVAVSSFTATGSASFTGNTSTVTFSGWVDFGIVVSSYTATSGALRVACPTGHKVISGTCEREYGGATSIVDFFYATDTTNANGVAADGSTRSRSFSTHNSYFCRMSASTTFAVTAVCGRLK